MRLYPPRNTHYHLPHAVSPTSCRAQFIQPWLHTASTENKVCLLVTKDHHCHWVISHCVSLLYLAISRSPVLVSCLPYQSCWGDILQLHLRWNHQQRWKKNYLPFIHIVNYIYCNLLVIPLQFSHPLSHWRSLPSPECQGNSPEDSLSRRLCKFKDKQLLNENLVYSNMGYYLERSYINMKR